MLYYAPVFPSQGIFREQTEEKEMNENDRPDAADGGVAELEAQIARVRAAQAEFAAYTQEQVDAIFKAAAIAADKARIPLA